MKTMKKIVVSVLMLCSGMRVYAMDGVDKNQAALEGIRAKKREKDTVDGQRGLIGVALNTCKTEEEVRVCIGQYLKDKGLNSKLILESMIKYYKSQTSKSISGDVIRICGEFLAAEKVAELARLEKEEAERVVKEREESFLSEISSNSDMSQELVQKEETKGRELLCMVEEHERKLNDDWVQCLLSNKIALEAQGLVDKCKTQDDFVRCMECAYSDQNHELLEAIIKYSESSLSLKKDMIDSIFCGLGSRNVEKLFEAIFNQVIDYDKNEDMWNRVKTVLIFKKYFSLTPASGYRFKVPDSIEDKLCVCYKAIVPNDITVCAHCFRSKMNWDDDYSNKLSDKEKEEFKPVFDAKLKVKTFVDANKDALQALYSAAWSFSIERSNIYYRSKQRYNP